MVKIRYAELPAGLHVVTEERAGCTIVYLLPGLTPSQRRAALTFAHQSARIGHGPSLPVIDTALALAADRARTSGRTVVAALRRHPVLLLPLVAVVSGVIVITMLSFVTVSMTPGRLPVTAPPSHRTGGRPGTGAGSASSGPPAVSPKRGGSFTTPNPTSSPASARQPTVLGAGRPGSASDTPSAGSAAPAAGKFCVTIGRTAICLRS
ncbi:MAG: hypothetical protein WBH47_21795 [Streptosporangiaceae bacterium]